MTLSDRSSHIEKGRAAEDEAERFFTSKGYQTICRNYHASRLAEIDLIVRNETTLVFVEVKSRSTSAMGGAIYSISKKKIMRLRTAARHFLLKKYPEFEHYYCRFDLFAVEKGKPLWIEDIDRHH
jgi:putative endonuclease